MFIFMFNYLHIYLFVFNMAIFTLITFYYFVIDLF